jgi:hypothetical protein
VRILGTTRLSKRDFVAAPETTRSALQDLVMCHDGAFVPARARSRGKFQPDVALIYGSISYDAGTMAVFFRLSTNQSIAVRISTYAAVFGQ